MNATLQIANYDSWSKASEYANFLERQGLEHTIVQKGEKFSVLWAQLDSSEKAINDSHQLNALAGEFSDSLTVADSNSFRNSMVVHRARCLAQHSTNAYSILVPENDHVIEVDSGHWVPALVFVEAVETKGELK